LQDIDQYLVMENKKESEVVSVRLENIKLKNKLKKKEMQLKSKVNYNSITIVHMQIQYRIVINVILHSNTNNMYCIVLSHSNWCHFLGRVSGRITSD